MRTEPNHGTGDMILTLNDIVQEYPDPLNKGAVVRIADGVCLEYPEPSINFIMGPSGCGKTTLLRLMGGVRPSNVVTPTSGTVTIDDKPCIGMHPDSVTVFQQLANYPFLTVEENIRFAFKTGEWAARVDAKEQDERVEWILEAVGLTDRRANYPSQCSGGQNQRIALASALVLKPRILLMDEPFRGLDPNTLREVQELLVRIWTEIQCLVVFVGHDVEEALLIADRVTVLTTKPATVAKEFHIATPRSMRSEDWLETTPTRATEREILRLMRG